MNTAPEPTVGTRVPLPHLGEHHHGIVVRQTWSESLGVILRVREATGPGATLLVYGDDLADLLRQLPREDRTIPSPAA